MQSPSIQIVPSEQSTLRSTPLYLSLAPHRRTSPHLFLFLFFQKVKKAGPYSPLSLSLCHLVDGK